MSKGESVIPKLCKAMRNLGTPRRCESTYGEYPPRNRSQKKPFFLHEAERSQIKMNQSPIPLGEIFVQRWQASLKACMAHWLRNEYMNT